MIGLTHTDLVNAAARWLARTNSVVLTELASGAGEEPDALGFKDGISTLVECKVSRADFHADKDKPKVRMGDYRYYLTPKGLVAAEDIPTGWGLLYADVRGVRVVIEASQVTRKHARGEIMALVSCLRRVGANAPEGVSIKCYTIDTKCRATLGVEAVRG